LNFEPETLNFFPAGALNEDLKKPMGDFAGGGGEVREKKVMR